ncbi:S1 RNA-binding domain-containing protein [Candidatus Nanosalina sp. VS9-1]|uniref:S1 RNA-binding domain-containing protein n=1 Tax=Candidatus Nanosalina sp. VS9-1 TaxID=3388566 RepID=UPI0039DFFAEA
MRWYKDRPEEGDFVVVTLTDVDKNSAYADLEEYEDVEGLIHISEVSRSWVQDMTKELSEGEKNVAQVIDAEGDTVTLSLKRVNDNNKRDTMERWKKEQKAESFIEDLAEKLDREVDDVYEDIGFRMQEEFGSSFYGFEISEAEEEKLQNLFDEDVVAAIQDVARDNIDLKQEKLEGTLELSFPQGDGVERIKEVLSDINDGVEVKYISAPEYSITAWGRTQELAKKRIDNSVRNIREKVDELDGNFEFSRA